MQQKLFCSIKCYSCRYTVVKGSLKVTQCCHYIANQGKAPPTCRTVKLHACVFYHMLPLLVSDVLHWHPQCLVFPLSGPRLRVLLCHLLSLSLLCPFDILCVATVSTCLETLPLYMWFSFWGCHYLPDLCLFLLGLQILLMEYQTNFFFYILY